MYELEYVTGFTFLSMVFLFIFQACVTVLYSMEQLGIMLLLLMSSGPPGLSVDVAENSDLDLYDILQPVHTYSVESTSALCLYTKIYSGEVSGYVNEINNCIETLDKISTNELFEAKKANSATVKRLINDLTLLKDHLELFRNDIKNLKKFTDGDNSTTLHRSCDLYYTLSFDPLLPMISQVGIALKGTLNSIKDDAKANADNQKENSVFEIVDVDSSILLNTVMGIRHFIDTVYDVHEGLLQISLPIPVLRYLNKEVEELADAVQEQFEVLNCEKVLEGLVCDLTVRQLSKEEVGFEMLPVPFLFENKVFKLSPLGDLIDSSSSLIGKCSWDQDKKCRNVKWSTNACLNALTAGGLKEIGLNCAFEDIPSNLEPLVQSTSEGLVFGASYGDAIIVLSNQQKITSFPVKVCFSGRIVYNKGEDSEVLEEDCKDNLISYLKYNETAITTIFKHASYWHSITNLIPDTHEEVMGVFNTVISLLTLIIGFIVACNCVRDCSKKRKRRRRRHKQSKGGKVKAKEESRVRCDYDEIELEDMSGLNRSRAAATQQH